MFGAIGCCGLETSGGLQPVSTNASARRARARMALSRVMALANVRFGSLAVILSDLGQSGHLPNVRIQPRVLSVGCNARLGLAPYGSSSESPKPAYIYLS